jgi:hypothetical protein
MDPPYTALGGFCTVPNLPGKFCVHGEQVMTLSCGLIPRALIARDSDPVAPGPNNDNELVVAAGALLDLERGGVLDEAHQLASEAGGGAVRRWEVGGRHGTTNTPEGQPFSPRTERGGLILTRDLRVIYAPNLSGVVPQMVLQRLPAGPRAPRPATTLYKAWPMGYNRLYRGPVAPRPAKP